MSSLFPTVARATSHSHLLQTRSHKHRHAYDIDYAARWGGFVLAKNVVHGGGRDERGPGLECICVDIITDSEQPEITRINLG